MEVAFLCFGNNNYIVEKGNKEAEVRGAMNGRTQREAGAKECRSSGRPGNDGRLRPETGGGGTLSSLECEPQLRRLQGSVLL